MYLLNNLLVRFLGDPLTCKSIQERLVQRHRQMITVLKMTPPTLLLVGTRLNDESLLYFASTLEAEAEEA